MGCLINVQPGFPGWSTESKHGWVSTRPPCMCLALLSLGASLSACQESGLRARAEFRIEWPEEMGYVDGALDESALTFGVVDTGTVSDSGQMSNPGMPILRSARPTSPCLR